MLFLFLFSFALAACIARLCAPLSRLVGALDIPDEKRHRHIGITGRLGGLSFSLPFFSVLLLLLLFSSTDEKALYLLLLSGGLLVTATGVADDVQSLSVSVKLLLMGGSACLPFLFGVFPPVSPFFTFFSVLFIITLMNAQNFIDGLDGLSGGLSLIGLTGIFLFAFWRGESAAAPIALALMAGILGFLPMNLPRARLFMGDTGSLFLGYAEGVLLLSLLFADSEAPPFSLFLLFSVPLGNLCFCVAARLIRRRSPFAADRLHIHHILTDRGMKDSHVLLLLLAAGTAGMLLGVLTALL